MRRFTGLAVVTVVAAFCGLGKSVEAAEVLRGTGLGGAAHFQSVDSTGCVEIYVTLTVNQNVSRQPPGPPPPPFTLTFISIDMFNSCIPESLFSGYASAEEGLVFGADRGLNQGTLSGIVRVCQEWPVQICRDLQIEMTWSGEGDTQYQRYTNFLRHGTAGYRTSSIGAFRGATAIGSIWDGSTNYTPEPSNPDWSWLEYHQSQEIIIDY